MIVADLTSLCSAYYVAFGPHGPRAPLHPPGTVPKLILAISLGVGAGTVLFLASRSLGEHQKTRNALFLFFVVLTAILATPPPKTMTKEWQEASNERARELNLDPITGKCTVHFVPPPMDTVLIPTRFRCPIRGIFREGLRAIQIDSGGRQPSEIQGEPSGLHSATMLYTLGYNEITVYSFLSASHTITVSMSLQ